MIRNLNTADDLVERLASLGNIFIYLLIALAVIYIIMNVVMGLIKGDNPDEKRAHLVNVGWGIAGLAIILSIWGLVAILTNTFTTDSRTPTERFPSADFINKQQKIPLYDIPAGGSNDNAGAV